MEPSRDHVTTPAVAGAAEEQTSEATGTSAGASFVGHGPIPPVRQSTSPPVPSASEQAYGDGMLRDGPRHSHAADIDRMRQHIATLATRDAVDHQRELLRRAATAPVIRVVNVPLVGSHDRVAIVAGEIGALIEACDERSATLQVAVSGGSFAGLAGQISPDRIAALDDLCRRYEVRAVEGLDGLARDQALAARLLGGVDRLDPVSAASLRRLGVLMRALAFVFVQERDRTFDVQTPGTLTREQAEAQAEAAEKAAENIRSGVFASASFAVAWAQTHDRDYANRAANHAAVMDGLMAGTASVLDGRAAAAAPRARDTRGNLESEPTVLGIDGADLPGMPQPVAPQRETTATDGGRHQRELATQHTHAQRLGPGRR